MVFKSDSTVAINVDPYQTVPRSKLIWSTLFALVKYLGCSGKVFRVIMIIF